MVVVAVVVVVVGVVGVSVVVVVVVVALTPDETVDSVVPLLPLVVGLGWYPVLDGPNCNCSWLRLYCDTSSYARSHSPRPPQLPTP